jgi:23S rRNA A2030 N6-methylase RlmJ
MYILRDVCVGWVNPTPDLPRTDDTYEHSNGISSLIKGGKLLDHLMDYHKLKKASAALGKLITYTGSPLCRRQVNPL